jgi:hypothetical protein
MAMNNLQRAPAGASIQVFELAVHDHHCRRISRAADYAAVVGSAAVPKNAPAWPRNFVCHMIRVQAMVTSWLVKLNGFQ